MMSGEEIVLVLQITLKKMKYKSIYLLMKNISSRFGLALQRYVMLISDEFS